MAGCSGALGAAPGVVLARVRPALCTQQPPPSPLFQPWCGHCKHLTPEYKKLGAAVAADPKLAGRVVVAKVDADAHRSLGERFGVRGFPTIKHFRRGQPVASPEE